MLSALIFLVVAPLVIYVLAIVVVPILVVLAAAILMVGECLHFLAAKLPKPPLMRDSWLERVATWRIL
jgi:hypothetical protein